MIPKTFEMESILKDIKLIIEMCSKAYIKLEHNEIGYETIDWQRSICESKWTLQEIEEELKGKIEDEKKK